MSCRQFRRKTSEICQKSEEKKSENIFFRNFFARPALKIMLHSVFVADISRTNVDRFVQKELIGILVRWSLTRGHVVRRLREVSLSNSKSGFRLAGRLRLHCIVRLIPWMQWRKSKYTQSKCIAQTSKYEVVCVGKLTVRQLGRPDCEANVFPQWTLLKCLFHLRTFYNKGV